MKEFKLKSPFKPLGDQPKAINSLAEGIKSGIKEQTLLGVTGSGKTFTMANVIEKVQKPTLVISHNKTLAAQLYEEFKEFFQMQLLNEKQEKLLLLSLNNRGQMLNCSVVHSGTLTSVDASVRDLVAVALRDRATAVVLAHNHPVGRYWPSSEDLNTTREAFAAFTLLGIEFKDHFIVAQDGCLSMRSHPHYAPIFSPTLSRIDRIEMQRKQQG